MHRRSRAASMGIAAVLVLVMAGCSSGDDEPGTGQDGDVLPSAAAISIADLTFEPSTLTVASGSTEITVANADSTDHTFTLDEGDVSEEIPAGQTVKVEVSLEASTGFHCEIHPAMTGTLQVA